MDQLIPQPEQEAIDDLIADAMESLGDFARDILRPDLIRNLSFFSNLDKPDFNQPEWHQWGILTHTEKCIEYMQTEAAKHITSWGIADDISKYLAVKPRGNFTRGQLLEIGFIYHDIGKFASSRRRGSPDRYNHAYHAKRSYELILDPTLGVAEFLKQRGLNQGEVSYVAEIGRRHMELGKIRLYAQKWGLYKRGYSFKYINGKGIDIQMCRLIAGQGDYIMDIGLCYLIDSLAKTDIRFDISTDEEARLVRKKILEQRSDHYKRFLQLAIQLPLNVALAGRYCRDMVDWIR